MIGIYLEVEREKGVGRNERDFRVFILFVVGKVDFRKGDVLVSIKYL